MMFSSNFPMALTNWESHHQFKLACLRLIELIIKQKSNSIQENAKINVFVVAGYVTGKLLKNEV